MFFKHVKGRNPLLSEKIKNKINLHFAQVHNNVNPR